MMYCFTYSYCNAEKSTQMTMLEVYVRYIFKNTIVFMDRKNLGPVPHPCMQCVKPEVTSIPQLFNGLVQF